MPPKKTRNTDEEYKKLKQAIAAGNPGQLYFLYGEESYLREYYFRKLRDLLLSGGMGTFNLHELNAKDMSPRLLEEAVDCLPMMAERTLILIQDYDIFKAPADDRPEYVRIFSQLPDYCCVVFYYDLVEYKPDGRKKLAETIRKYGSEVCFARQSQNDLVDWIIRRFRALGKDIDRRTATELIFHSGDLMTNLLGEIEKVAAYASHRRITSADIEAVAIPQVDAVVFRMTDAIGERNFDRACKVLGDLIQMKESPVALLVVLSRNLRQFYSARLALEARKGPEYLADLWGIKPYPAEKLFASARRLSLSWCRRAVIRCAELDSVLKSRPEKDQADVLTGFLLELAGMNL